MKHISPYLVPLLIFPATTHAASFQTFITGTTLFLNDTIIPFLLGVAFLFFVFNAIRYFVLNGSNEDGQEKAKALAIYGVLAFTIIVIFWGIVNMLVDGIGLGGGTQPTNDYEDLYGP